METVFISKEKIKNVRLSQNIKQKELAEKVCMDQAQYCRRESGKLYKTDEEWNRLATAFNVDKETIYESELPSLKIVTNNENKGNSINGFEIIIKTPNEIIENLFTKIDKLITLMENSKQ